MIFDASAPDYDCDIRCVDPATGAVIPYVCRCDTEKGEMVVLKTNEDGKLALDGPDDPQELTIRRPFRVVRLSTGETVAEAA